VSPPTESSAAVSFARAGAPAPARAAIASAEAPIRDTRVRMPELAISDLGPIIAFRSMAPKRDARVDGRRGPERISGLAGRTPRANLQVFSMVDVRSGSHRLAGCAKCARHTGR